MSMRREVDILKSLDHPNVVRLYEALEDDDGTHLVMEYLEGGDLLERIVVSKERMPEEECASVMTQILDAVQHLCSRNIVHRDLKPEKEYFSLACWSAVSPVVLDFLGRLLQREPHHRPTVWTALKHPWLTVRELGPHSPLPHAVRLFSQAPCLRRLALAAAAREIDDTDLFHLRAVYRILELECGGQLTRMSLDSAGNLNGVAGELAQELQRWFDYVDIDGSGAIDWTELVAVALSAADAIGRSPDCPAGWDAHDVVDSPKVHPDLPQLTEDACWRAFDLLSQSSGAVSDLSLCRLLVPTELGVWLAAGMGPRCPELAKFRGFVQVAASPGSVTASRFAKLLVGKYDL